MKKTVILFFILLASIFPQNKKLTLRESLDIGLKNSKDLKISQAQLTGAEAQTTAAASQLLPQLSFAAGYTRLSDIPPFQVTVPFSPTPIKISDVILNSYQLKLSLQQNLFDGFRSWALKSAANYNYRAEKMEYSKDVNEAAMKIQNAYWNYYKAELNQKVVEENLAQIKQHLEDTKNFLKNELATQNDVLKLQVQYSNAKLQKIEMENNVDIARIAFNQAIGVSLESNTILDVKEIFAQPVEYDFKVLLNEAKQNRKELRVLELRTEASEEQITAAKSGWFPQIFLFGNYYYSKPNQRIIPAENKFNDTWDVGISLNWSLWNWGYTSAQASIAEQNKIEVETNLSKLNDAVEIEVYQNYLTMKRAYEKVQVTKVTVEQAEENYRTTKEKYNAQISSSTDLIDADVLVTSAKTNYNNSLVDYELAKVKLDKSIGRKIY